MSVLLPILLAFLAVPPAPSDTLDGPPPARAVHITTGSPHTLSVSGASGTVTTRMPGNDAIFHGIDIDESGDAPCQVDLYWWRENGDSNTQGAIRTTFTLCGTQSQASGLAAVGHDGGADIALGYSSTPEFVYYAAHGIRTCLNSAGTRVKGVRLFGSTVNQDNDREVRRDPALKRDFERTNCNTWQTIRKCPAGEVIVGLDIHHDGSSIKGLAPKCAAVTVTQDNSVGVRRSN